ncbi:putative disease resistance protein RGA3 [Papaver somniferum]|uniref:putative disease resistance protein RGA3 n=1 Tax=Papaver somniferum TaxID=3469 RepID=UPI000E6F6EE2|nr:putative disease resistance protein RGA3 [Papaver somniferum]
MPIEDIKQDKVLWLSAINFGFKMAKKIKKLNQELDEIAKHNVTFQLDQTSSHDSTNFQNIGQQNRLTSFVGDLKIVGRDKDKSHIMKMLLMMANPSSPSSSSENNSPPEKISVVSIVGKFMNRLVGKNICLVLDDLWNEDADDWEKLKGILNLGAHGSKILVTTRKYHVASIIRGIIPPYSMKTLSVNNCWSIIKNKAFSPSGALETPSMSNIGEEIARKCDGLPLAAHFLGNLMRLKKDECDWVAIRDNKILNTPENPNKILQILKLSYDNLPSHLKQCFSYCSLFPKHWDFNRETLIQLWMAEGFLYLSDGGNQNSLEDIVHDLAQTVVGSHEVTVMNVSEMENGVSDVRRLQFIMEDGISKGASNVLNENAKKMRAIFCRDVLNRLGPLRNKQ